MAKPTPVPGLDAQTPLPVAGALLVASRLADVRRHARELAAPFDPDAVHDLRVATRRLRAALRLFGAERLRSRERRVKRLQDALGEVRDLHVQLAWLDGLDGGAAAVLDARARRRVRSHLGRRLPDHTRALAGALKTWERKGARKIAGRLHAVRAGALGEERMRRRLERRVAEVAERAAKVRAAPTPGRAHRLRIAAKKLRYAAELLQPAFPERCGALLEALVPLQERLGALHDVDVRIDRMRSLSKRGGRTERRAARRLLAHLVPERARLGRALVEALPRPANGAGAQVRSGANA